jgi:ABC-type dipeptide/oligopeptide/nickel transport system ATPase subunit
MQDRYMIRDEVLSKVDPQNPGERVYRIYDRLKQEYGLGYYLSWETANKMVEKKNGKVNR